MQSRRLTAH